MIKIIAQFYVKEDGIEKTKVLCRDMAAETKKENGCISYDAYQDDKDPAHFVFVEEWTDAQVLEKHNETMHFINFIARMKELKEKDWVVETFAKIS